MIRRYPKDYELVAFFESEPTLLDVDVPWIYNTLDFITVRHGLEVRCHLSLSSGVLSTRLLTKGAEIAKFELRDINTIEIIIDGECETLVATLPTFHSVGHFALQLRPTVYAVWDNLP